METRKELLEEVKKLEKEYGECKAYWLERARLEEMSDDEYDPELYELYLDDVHISGSAISEAKAVVKILEEKYKECKRFRKMLDEDGVALVIFAATHTDFDCVARIFARPYAGNPNDVYDIADDINELSKIVKEYYCDYMLPWSDISTGIYCKLYVETDQQCEQCELFNSEEFYRDLLNEL